MFVCFFNLRYKAIEVCICKKSDSITDHNNNLDESLHKCLKCLEYAKITNYKVNYLLYKYSNFLYH